MLVLHVYKFLAIIIQSSAAFPHQKMQIHAPRILQQVPATECYLT
jgi:hypothetical protein